MWRSEGSAGDYEVLNLHIEDQHESLFSIPSHVFLGWANPTGDFISVLESKNKSLLFFFGGGQSDNTPTKPCIPYYKLGLTATWYLP